MTIHLSYGVLDDPTRIKGAATQLRGRFHREIKLCEANRKPAVGALRDGPAPTIKISGTVNARPGWHADLALDG
jgi:hypothetical protein